VLYDASRLPVVCQGSRYVAPYELEVGNTGRAPQPDVRLRLRAAVVAAAPTPVHVRDFGKLDRPFAVTDGDGIRTYALGPLAPEARVVLSFVLIMPSPAGFPAWEDILVGVEPAEGKAYPGNPGWTALLRIWYSLARVV